MPKQRQLLKKDDRHQLMSSGSTLRGTTRPPEKPKVRMLRPLPIDAQVGASRAPTLLYDRRQAAGLLGGVCTMTLVRLERQGKLTPIRLSSSPKAHVFYNAIQ